MIYETNVDESIKAFEEVCKSLHHYQCTMCKMVSLNLVLSYHDPNNIYVGVCNRCTKTKKDFALYKPYLPTWETEDGTTMYTIPKELSCLRDAEKLLISQYLPYIPLHHLRKGQLGIKGHVCCFVQDVLNICTILPRLPSEVAVIRVIRRFRDDSGNVSEQKFMVRRREVLAALYWLKENNKVYNEITIDENKLDWIR